MLEYYGDIEVGINADVAHLNAQGCQLTLTVTSPAMLSALLGVYRRHFSSGISAGLPFMFDNHQLEVIVPNGGSVAITRRLGWAGKWFPYQFAFTGWGWWCRYGPALAIRYLRDSK